MQTSIFMSKPVTKLLKNKSHLLVLLSLLVFHHAQAQSTASFLNNLLCDGGCISTTAIFPDPDAPSAAFPSPLSPAELSLSYLPSGSAYRGTDNNYGVVAGGNYIVPDTGGIHAEGRVAVGGNLIINKSGYEMAQSGFGTFLVGNGGGAASPAVAVGGLVSGSGSLGIGYNKGGTYTVRSAGANTLTKAGGSTGHINSSGSGSSGVNIPDLISGMKVIAANMLGTTATGTITGRGTYLRKNYQGSEAALEIFRVANSTIPTSDSIFFSNIAKGATVVVNITDTGALTVNWTPHIGRAGDPLTAGEPDAQVFNVVFNFPNARSVRFLKPMIGTVLIPNGDAILEHEFYGRLIVSGNVIHSGRDRGIYNFPFTGDLSSFSRISVSGHVFNDANGMTDSFVNSTSDRLYPLLMWVNLFNTSGKVVATTPVGEDGYYKLDSLSPGTYFVQLSSGGVPPAAGVPGADTPVTRTLYYKYTGEQFGTDKGSDGLPDGLLSIGTIPAVSIADANFGVDLLPFTDDFVAYISTPSSTARITLDGTEEYAYAPFMRDVEDGDLSFGAKMVIDSIPVNSKLFYHDTAVTAGHTIDFFDPALLQVQLDSSSWGATSTSFRYAFFDAAGLRNPEPATYILAWDNPLPTPVISISGHLFNDANGMTDSLVNATAFRLYYPVFHINLFNTTGKVIATSTLSDSGTYAFSSLKPGTYFLQVSFNTGVPGMDTPYTYIEEDANTGEHIGTDKGSDGLPDGILATGYISNSISNANFGVEHAPYNIRFSTGIATPDPAVLLTLDGKGANPPTPSADDEEDKHLDSGATLIIDSLPVNSTLLYHDTAVKAGQEISHFNPSLLQLRFSSLSKGAVSTSFHYAFRDRAGFRRPWSAKYELAWDTPLPLKLLEFDAVVLHQQAALSWRTAAEDGVDAYHIEWSKDGQNYQQIGVLQANGSLNSTRDYRFTSPNLSNGNNFYRLQIAGTDGTAEYSPVRNLVLSEQSDIPVQVYPNPASDMVTVAALQPGSLLQLYNSSGQQVTERRATESKELLQLGHLPPGNYQLLIRDGKDQITQFKISKY